MSNPFEDAKAEAVDGQAQLVAASETPSAMLARAEIDRQIATAKAHPRILSVVKRKMLDFATLDSETAEGCFYKLPRGGKVIEGPSIRLAEIAACTYQNMRIESRVIDTDLGDNPHVTIRAMAFDLENNVAVAIEKRRRITGKKSKGGVPDEDDINLAVNAGSAIALRDAIFKVVPLALVKPVMEQAKRTATGDAKTLTERRGKCIDQFSKMGVSKDRVLAAIEKQSVDDIGLAELETLIGLFTAIKDGQTNIDEAFPPLKPGSETPGKPKVAEAAKPAEAPTATALPTDATQLLTALRNAIAAVDVTEDALLSYCRGKGLAKSTQKLSDLATVKLQQVLTSLPQIIEELMSASEPAK
jgi:hypothetical protein